MEADPLALLERTPVEVWNEDLDQFLVKWEVRLSHSFCGKLSGSLFQPHLALPLPKWSTPEVCLTHNKIAKFLKIFEYIQNPY